VDNHVEVQDTEEPHGHETPWDAFFCSLMTAVDELAEHFHMTGFEVQRGLIAALHEVTHMMEDAEGGNDMDDFAPTKHEVGH